MRLRRLLPEPGTVDVAGALAGLRLGDRAPAKRPYVVVNFVATADGKATIGGRSGPIGDAADRALFHRLRGDVDAVLAGTGTLRTERYGRLVSDPAAREARVAAGLSPEPLAVTATQTMDLPLEIPLFQEPGARIEVFTWAARSLPHCAADVRVTRLESTPGALAPVLSALRAEHGVRSLLCEGGPTIFAALLAQGLVDELFLSLAPRLAGGGERPISQGAAAEATDLELLSVLEHEGSLFLRYAVRRP